MKNRTAASPLLPTVFRKNQAAVLALLEAAANREKAARRDRQLKKAARKLEKAIRYYFVRQGNLFVKELAVYKGRFDRNAELVRQQEAGETAVPNLSESLTPSDWLPFMARAEATLGSVITKALKVAMIRAAFTGANEVLLETDGAALGIFFNLKNPRTEDYANRRAGVQIGRINDSTRKTINHLIVTAVSSGTPWNRLKKQLKDRFKQFGKKRAHRIAVFELGDAYEGGQDIAVQRLQAAGLGLQQQWLSSRDALVRPEHKKNDREGWVPINHTFTSGDKRPPTDPGCRCTRRFKRKPSQRP